MVTSRAYMTLRIRKDYKHNMEIMEKTIRFFKINEGIKAGWYADVPGHTLEENQMVSGSDTFLEEVDSILGGRGEVTVTVADSLDENTTPYMAKLNMHSHNQWGATYVLTGPVAEQYGAVGFEMWICNVTHDVLGEHTKAIYILDIK